MWMQAIADTISRPRDMARHLIALNPPMALRWQGFLLMTLLSTVLPFAAGWIAGGEMRAEFAAASPFVMVLLQLAFNGITVVLVHRIGQALGGKGTFPDALLLIVWMQVVLMVPQLAQCLVMIVAPGLMLPIIAASGVLLFWLLSNFTAELHGFQSALRVFGSICGIIFLIALLMTPFVQPYVPVPTS
jgi:Yip1 domain